MSIYPIEKGIPIPSRRSGSYRKYAWWNLGVGDSFFVPCKPSEVEKLMNSLTNSRQWAQETTGCKFVLRTIRSPYREKTGVRAWRIK